MKKKIDNSACPVTATIDLIGGRWKVVIISILLKGTKRFGEISARMPNVSRKVLTEQLKEMESDGLILRQHYNEVPPRVEYSLTELGQSLNPIISAMNIWGKEKVIDKK
jgi:DNA-binding HxlR family transcriptional regulator